MKKACIILTVLVLFFAGCAEQGEEISSDDTKEKTTTTQAKETTTLLASTTTMKEGCQLLWWYDDEHTDYCRDKEFCGAYMYESLKTFATEEECMASIPTTTTTTLFLRSGLALGAECIDDLECDSRCCVYQEGRMTCMVREECRRELTMQECLARNMHWCAALCQKEECQRCGNYMRCVQVQEEGATVTKVETAVDAEEEGSCTYTGEYRDAGGEGSYCDKYEGTLIYAKCGGTVSFEDCKQAYNETGNATYFVTQKRSFHAPDGDEQDLWCFICARAN